MTRASKSVQRKRREVYLRHRQAELLKSTAARLRLLAQLLQELAAEIERELVAVR